MEEFQGYGQDPVFADLTQISDKSTSDFEDEYSSSIGGYSSGTSAYSYTNLSEPIYGGNTEALLADAMQSVSSFSNESVLAPQLSTSNNSVSDVNSIGCGCAACSGDNAVSASSGDSSGYIVMDAQVSGVNGKDSLDSGYSWANDGTGLNLSFNFITSLPGYYSGVGANLTSGFQAMNANQAAASREVLNVIENYINVTFSEIGSGSTADMAFGQVARSENTVVAHAFLPTGHQAGGDVFLNTNFWGYDTDPNYGDLVYQTLFHEIGHALGLKHSFDAGSGSGDILSAAEENNNYSVMSYTRLGGNAGSMMMHDIAQLQELYGVNTSYNTGNNTYTFTSGTHFTIWDAGGTDTLSGAGQSADLTIRLEDGSLSELGTTRVGIAFNAEIENAIGGSGNDSIYGNDLNNTIQGGGGDDTIYGTIGSDNIDGQAGDDSVNYSYNDSAFTYNFINSVTVAITHAGLGFTDTLSNIENFIFNNNTYTFDTLQDAFGGGGGGGGGGDTTPILVGADLTLDQGEVASASVAITATDADGDALTYTIYDGTAGRGYYELDGVALGAKQNHVLNGAEFARLNIVGGSTAGNDTLWVRVTDGDTTTAWQSFRLTTTADVDASAGGGGGGVNLAPIVTTSDLSLAQGGVALASSVITANDPNGDALTYTLWDGGKGGNSGYFQLGSNVLEAGKNHVLSQAEFNAVTIYGGSVAGTEALWVKVSDGEFTTNWKSFNLTTTGGGGGGGGNSAPTVSSNSLTLDQADGVLASTVITASDADGDALSYIIYDGGGGNSTGYFELDGVELGAKQNHTLTEAEFSRLYIIGGDAAQNETLWVRVSAGGDQTAWSSFTLTTSASYGGSGGGGANSAPTVSTDNLSLQAGNSVLASSVITVNDADGDALTYYVWDGGKNANTGYYELDGSALDAGRSIALTEAEFSRLNIVGGTNGASETMWVQVSDGAETTKWYSFTLTSSAAGAMEVGEVIEEGSAEQDAIDAFTANGEEAFSGGSDDSGLYGGYESVQNEDLQNQNADIV